MAPDAIGRDDRGWKIHSTRWLRLVVAIATALTFSACKQDKQVTPPPPSVSVGHPIEKEATEWDEYIGRFDAVDYVEVRARVSGYLQEIHFTEGALVHAGDLLVTIDPRPYEAVLQRAQGDLAAVKARLELARSKHERAAPLLESHAISKEEMDTRVAETRQEEAALQAAIAAVETARLDVEFTQIRSPVSGRVGRKLVTPGNLITGGSGASGTSLTTVVSLDPIHILFEADERSYLKYIRLSRSGERPSSRDVPNPVWIGLADEEGFPHLGHMDFVDNQIEQGTGTILGRAVVPNPDLGLIPGMFARVRLQGSGTRPVILVPDAAIGSDQAEKFVWVVDDQNRAQYRRIHVGGLYEGLRIVRDGVTVNDRVIVAGTQRARPGVEMVPEETPIAVNTEVPVATLPPSTATPAR